MKQLVLLTGPLQKSDDQRFLDLAAWMGVSAKLLVLPHGSVANERLDSLRPGLCCLAMSAETLGDLAEAMASGSELCRLFDGCCAELLIFGCGEALNHIAAVSRLTAGAVYGMSVVNDSSVRFTFPREAQAYSRQLAGLDFSRRNGESIPTFELRETTCQTQVIVAVNDRPMFVRVNQSPCNVFLLAGAALLDIEEPISRDRKGPDYYDRVIPILMFLRHGLSDHCWHGPEPTARLIIDDPLLTERYGFLEYSALVKSMQHTNYGTSVAFIPWNYWRTSRRDVSRIFDEAPNLSICVHGCDHSNKEFEEQDLPILDRKAAFALSRMEAQKQRTGVDYDRVMVFPQGRFSTAAISALRAHNYLAVVNSTCFPVDCKMDDITIGDSLRPAITRYDGVPIFNRRYPQSLFDSALDMFLGRPVFLVEHHEYFRNGCRMLEEFVADLYKLEPALSWPNLTTQLMRCCLRKILSNGSCEVQFFTRKFQLYNCKKSSGHFLLRKHEPDATAIQKVLVNGASVPFSFEKDFLKLEVQADHPGEMLDIEIMDREKYHKPPNGFGIVHNAGVMLRRGLSEFRDNTLVRHNGLLKIGKGIARRLKVTGDS